ncbi:MAG: rod shape-determining protein MreC [Rikenellaceae bacterium]|nr:rod shape-determining protein MreC [Rikenellaceae bacterium]
MLKLVEFIKKVYLPLLFVVLEIVAIHYYAHSNSYAEARLLSTSNSIVGGVYGSISGVSEYFGLRKRNRVLLDEMAALQNELTRYRESEVYKELDSLGAEVETKFSYMTARVVRNTVNRQHNYLTLNKGQRDGVEADMAVITPDGAMVGYVVSCSERYAVAISILNTNFNASGKLAGDGHSGSIYWDGFDVHRVKMHELSKYAPVEVGDTIVSTGYSHFFPEDITIGYIEHLEVDEPTSSFKVELRLAADMTRLNDVVLIKNFDIYELTALEAEANSLFRN